MGVAVCETETGVKTTHVSAMWGGRWNVVSL